MLAAQTTESFTWTGISTGNPTDWALRKFPMMGFNTSTNSAIIYDSGTEFFTGTTLEGIAQSVLGVLQHPEETKNRFVKVRSIKTNQKILLAAFETATGKKWRVEQGSSSAMKESGKAKFKAGLGGWIIELVVAQVFDEGEGRCVLVPDDEMEDVKLLGVLQESVEEVVAKVLNTA